MIKEKVSPKNIIASALQKNGLFDLHVPEPTDNSKTVLARRYLWKDHEGNIIEDHCGMFRRVAINISQSDLTYSHNNEQQRKITEEKFYNVMRMLYFLPNSPTLMNAGGELQQLSACFVLPIDDSIEDIFQKVKYTALIHKSGGGTGFSFSRLRPSGDVVGSTGGIASGPVSFIRAFDTATDVVKQGGTRRGANMGVLHVTHPDIMQFIHSKRDGTQLLNFNISVAVTNDFMHRAEQNKEYDLVNPRSGKIVGQLNARDVLNDIVELAWETGDPGLVFIDHVNETHPNNHLGDIESCNPCVASDTWIHTTSGPKQVKELIGKQFTAIIEGMPFNSLEEGFFYTGTKDVYKINTKEGFSVKLTADHLVKMHSGEWKPVVDLLINDEIKLNNHTLTPYWDGEYTSEQGYIIGLLMGDGWIPDTHAVLSLWNGIVEDQYGAPPSYVVAVIDRALSAVQTMPHRSDFTGWHRYANCAEQRLTTSSIKELANELGLYKQHKFVTPEIEQTSFDFHIGFLQGFFDTDGSVVGSPQKGASVRLSQSNLTSLESVQRMLARIGIISKVYKQRRPEGIQLLPNSIRELQEYNTKAQHDLVISGENLIRFNQIVGFTRLDKKSKLDTIISNYKRAPDKEKFTARILSIEKYGIEDVYDVSIPGINAFDANGLYVHNCGEQFLLDYESCNLGSINMARMTIIDDNSQTIVINNELLRETCFTAVHFLDNVIDMNNYPVEEIKNTTKKTRRIGVGVMGVADMLIQMGIPYNSEEAIDIASQVMSDINLYCKEASEELAKTRGPYPAFEGSKYNIPIRNTSPTCIAPTGTISVIAGASSGIEPLFALSYVRNVMDGTKLTEYNPYLKYLAESEEWDMESINNSLLVNGDLSIADIPEWSKEIFVSSYQITPEWHIRMQSAFQQFTDNAVSKTVNFPNHATIDDVREVYEMAYRSGCKGVTIYRDGSKRDQVLTVSTNSTLVEKTTRDRPREMFGVTKRINTGHGIMYVTVNHDENNLPFEVFGLLGKAGGCDAAMLEAITRLSSLTLRSGIDPNLIVRQLNGITCCPIWDNGKKVTSIPDTIALAISEVITQGINKQNIQPSLFSSNGHSTNGHDRFNTYDKCPECGEKLVYEEGCVKCYSCGISRC